MTKAQIKELWPRAALWLLFLGPFFFITYGWANRYGAYADTASLVFWWEHKIPFIPWTIVPYWSIDLLYGISLFICTSRRELNIHALRLLAASALCCLFFIIIPMEFTFTRPQAQGLFGHLFTALESFDLPYNQAPSLHIALAWIIWLRFRAHMKGFSRLLLGAWFLLIGISVLTTWQHHFIDIPTGFFAGLIITYLLPVETKWRKWQSFYPEKSSKLSLIYFSGALIFLLPAVFLGGWAWLFLWPAAALMAVAAGYKYFGVAVFQKNERGEMSLSAKILLAPYRAGAWISYLYFSKKAPVVSQITPQIYLGSFPRGPIKQDCLLDMTAEFSSAKLSRGKKLICCPRMDLAGQSPQELQEALQALSALEKHGTVLIFCALGLSRSALVVAAKLMADKQAKSARDAVEKIRKSRPQIVIGQTHLNTLAEWKKLYNKSTQ